MNKKLYRVAITLYVMAEDKYDACWAATNARFDVFECVAEEAKNPDPGWEDAVPYNADDERTCAEILASQPQAAPLPPPPISWVEIEDGASLGDPPGKRLWGGGAYRPRIRGLVSRLFSVTPQDLKDAAIHLTRTRD